MTDSKGRQLRKVNQLHAPDGPYAVYSDGDGHYAVVGPNGVVIDNQIACDYCNMKAIELNRAS